jgi:hypothetical protein
VSAGPASARRGQDGFVLVGVVIFVLALTIIGLSLFSISGYEAQFLQGAADGEQAFQSAMGGLARARFVLSLPNSRLENVTQDLPLEDVIAASARQVQNSDTASTGPVDWTPTNPVFLRVTARVNGRDRTIEGSFSPRESRTYYTQLLTTSGRITVDSYWPQDRTQTVFLGGRVWQGTVLSAADTLGWLAALPPWPDRPRGILTGTVDAPDLASYFASHPPGTADYSARYFATSHRYPPQTWRLRATSHSRPTYNGPPAGQPANAMLRDQTSIDPNIWIRGSGCAIWEVPMGLQFDYQVKVGADDPQNSCLVIVAGASPADPLHEGAGIRFFGGIQSSIPVILVSDGLVAIQHGNNLGLPCGSGHSSFMDDLAIYAHDVRLTGPVGPSLCAHGIRMTLQHPALGSRIDDYWVDLLASWSALPNIGSGGGRQLDLVSGSWRASGR